MGLETDSSSENLLEANRRVAIRDSSLNVQFVEADARSFHVEPDSMHLVMCMGASHAFGLGANAYNNALEQIMPLLAPGGSLLIAEGYMKQPATSEYRKLLGETMPDEMTHSANVTTGKQLGLIPMAAWTSGEDEWDDFEWSHQRIAERRAEENPDDLEAASALKRRR